MKLCRMRQEQVGHIRQSRFTMTMTGATAAIKLPARGGRKWIKAVTLASRRLLLSLMAVVGGLSFVATPVKADPYPPYWQGGNGPAVHFQPEPWPDEPADPTQCGMNCGDWIPYTRYALSINDARTQDPSNGGTSPQNYVNIASSCIDESYPSIYYYLDLDNEVLMFRWRVEQVANTYATGPTAGSYSSSDPWSSALWTVFFDLDGDGYRDLAAHLDGSSGSPAAPIDRLVGIWADVPNSQSLNYYDDPNIHDLAHNPTGFVYSPTNRILNFHTTAASPDDNWPNGAAETIWNYGPSRSKVITLRGVDGSTCDEYFVDYQIPLELVDASAFGGPKIDRTTPFSMLFCTANSLNDPFQKDCAYQGDWIGDPNREGPFGDYVSFEDDTIDQPIVTRVDASGCGPTELAVDILDTIDLESGVAKTSVKAVGFYYYYDMNGDGEDNDDNSWTHAVTATNVTINRWTATWNSAGLLQGQYLVAVQAVDDGSKNDDGYANRVFSYLSQAEVDALDNVPASSGEEWYPNPDVTGVVATALFANACGAPVPFVGKTVEPSQVTTGETVTFTVAISNTHTDPLTVTVITDTLPPGFVYGDAVAGTLSPTTSPSVGATGDITWTFCPAAIVAPSSTDTLVFTATAPSIVGAYANVVSVKTETGFGTLTSEPVQVSVGAPRLSIAKSASTLSASPGDTITYTITYGNDSTVNVTGAVITDVLPAGVDLVSVLDGGSESGGTITWNVGDLQAGEGPFTARFVVTVTNPYPDVAAVPLVNTATIDGDETDPTSASSTTFVDTPRPAFAVQKDGDKIVLDPGDEVTFTLDYANTGNYTATNATITDNVPDGFTVVRAGSGVTGTGIVTWSIGDVVAGATGFVTLTLEASNPFTWTNPTTNTVALGSTQTGLISDTYRAGITAGGGGQNCYTPTAIYDTSDDSSDVTVVQTDDNTTYDVYNVPDGAYDGTYQAFTFTNSIVPESSTVTSVTVNHSYYEKNDDQLRIQAVVDGAVLCSDTGYDISGKGDNDYNDIDLYSSCIDTPYEVNNLGLRYSGYGHGGAKDVRTDYIELCVIYSSPPIPVLDKQVSSLIAEPGERLTYTVEFGNPGGADITGAVITDTLPTGVTLDSATLNGSPVTLGNPSPSVYTLTVNSSDTGTAGRITAGESGTLLVMVNVDTPLADGVDALLNTAVLDGNGIAPITDTIPTAVLRPDLSISKAANDTSLVPGDTVTFTLTVLNSGYATATNVTISDTLPATSYFTYVVGSTRLNGAMPGSDPVSGDLMSLDVGELGPGDSAQVTFQMYAHTSGVPDGATELGNTAAVTSTQTREVSSEAVVVSINANPNLRLVKSLEPSGTLSPGARITFTLIVSNVGASDAVNVQVRDPIPGDTNYVAGTLIYSGTAQTDVDDADEGRLDAAGNRVVFEVGDLPSGEGRTMQFTVLVDEPLPNGTTCFTNTATVSAGNAAAKSSTATAEATAAPNVTVSKTGADTLAYPAATLTADVSNAVVFQVDDGSQLEVDQYVRVNGYDVQVTAISGSAITVAAPITATSGTTVTGSIIYSIGYANGGTAVANNAVITDTLPPQSAFITATAPHVRSGNTITWTVSSLEPDESGSVQVTVFLTGTGSFTNTAYTSSDETALVSDTVTTSVGGLRVRKRTTTPVVTQTLAGTSATYLIEVENTSTSDAGGVVVTDTLAAGFTFSETLDIAGGTRDPSTPDPSAGDAQPAWGTFTVTGSSTLYITFTVSISDTVGPATYQNQVLVTSSDTSVIPFDPLLVPDEDVEVQVPVVRLSKTVTPTAVGAGYPVTYTIVAYNIGEAAAQGVIITDSLPSGFTYASTASMSEITVTRTSTYATATPSWGVWDIAPTGKVTVTFVLTSSSSTGTFSNTVLASSDSISIPTVSDVAPVTVTPLSDLSVTKAMSDTTPDVGSTVRFTVTVTNDGPSDATNVEVTDELPSGYTYGTSWASQGTYANVSGMWNAGTVSASESATLLITATVGASGDYGNEAEVTAVSEDDPDSTPNDGSGDDYASVTASPNPVADLQVSKSDSADPVAAGGTLTYTIVVENNGPSDATGVVVTDTLPGDMNYASHSLTDGSYDSGTGVWTVGALSTGSSETLTLVVDVDADATGSLSNQVDVGGAEPDPAPGNDGTSESTAVNVEADVSMVKTIDDATLEVGSTVVFTVTASNAGPSDAVNVVITDVVDSRLRIETVSANASHSGQEVTASFATIPVSSQETVVITATLLDLITVTEGTQITNAVFLDYLGNPSGPVGSNVVTGTIAEPSVTLDKSVEVEREPVGAGDVLTYTLVLRNEGSGPAYNVWITDTLPSGLTYVATQEFSVTDPPAAVLTDTNASGDTVLTWGVSQLDGAGLATWQEQGVVFDPVTNRAYHPSVLYNAAAFGNAEGEVISGSLPYTYQVTPYYKMWVATGGGAAGIQYAYSDDGTTWYEFNGGTALSGLFPSGYHGIVLYDPDEFDGTGYKYRVWYWDGTTNYTVTDIRTADSTDGIIWENDQGLTQDAVAPIVTGGASDWSRGTYGPVWLFYNASSSSTLDDADVWNNKYVMYYDATTGGREDVGLGYSTDGVQWKRYGDDPVLPAGPTSWDSFYTTYGTVMRGANGTYRFWYSGGTTASHHGIGYASSRDGAHWTKSLDNPLLHVDDGIAYRDERTYTPIVLYSLSGFDGHGASAEYKMWFSCRAGSDYRICYADNAIGSGGAVTITYTARVSEAIGADLALSNAAQGAYDGQPGDDPDERGYSIPTATVTTTTGQPAFELKKSTSATWARAGELLTYTIAVTNTGLVSATNVSIADVVPADTAFVTASLPHDGPSSSGMITWSLGTLNIGLSQAVTMVVRVPGSASEGAVITNTAWVTSFGISTVTTSTITTTVSARADLSLDKSSAPVPAVPGEAIAYTILVTNAGPSAVTAITLTDDLPAAVQGPSYSPSEGSYDDGTGAWTGLSFGAGETITLTIVGRLDPTFTGNLQNTAVVTPTGADDPTPGDDDDDDTNPVSPQTDLSISKVSRPKPFAPGEVITYTIVVTNAGPSAVTAITLTDDLPAAVQGPSYSPSEGSYSEVTGAWTGLSFGAGETITLTIVGTVAPAFTGTLRNTAVVTPVGANDPDPGDDDDDDVNSLSSGTVTGVIYLDEDGNGGYTPGVDIPLPGVDVVITDALGTVHTVTTGLDGAYTIAIPAGDATVDVDDTDLPPNVVLDTGSTDPTTVTVPAGGTVADDTGYVQFGTVSGTVYLDENGDGVYTPGVDTPLPSVDVVITDAFGIAYTVTTDAGGAYTLTLPAGDATVDVDDADLPPGVTLDSGSTDPTTVTVPGAGGVIDNTGYELPAGTGTVSGTIYLDEDGDGAYTPGVDTPLVGVRVVITDVDGVTYTVTTDAGGAYAQVVPAGATVVDVDDGMLPAGAVLDSGSTDPTVVIVTAGGIATDDTGYVVPELGIQATKRDFLFVDADLNGIPTPGDTLSYVIVITNSGSFPLTGVAFSDIPDSNTTLVIGSVTTSLGSVTSGNAAGDTHVTVDVGDVMPRDSVAIGLQVTINDPLPPGVTQVTNQGVVGSNELPAEPTDDPDTPEEDDDTETSVSGMPDVEAYKSDALFVDADGDGVPSPGDALMYQVMIVNTGGGAAEGILFADLLADPNLDLVTGTVQTSLGTVVSGNNPGDTDVTVDIGALPGGGVVEISYQAVVSDPLPAGVTQVANQGVASGDNFVDEPTDDPDTPEDDDDTQTSLVICSVPADIYEPDNLYTYAAEIPTDGTVQTHTLHVAADKDWVRFYAQVGKIYTLTTSHLLADVDTVLELYDADGVTLLDENDDYLPGSNASRIVWAAPAEGWYYARVTHFDHTYDPRESLVCGNQFLLAVVEAGVCPVGPDTYEPDNLYTDALTIPTDGSVQFHTFHVAADKDWTSFYAFAGRVYTLTTSQLDADVDTVLELYDADGVALLEENDDYLSGSNASRIVWTASTEGRYYVRITHFDRTYDPRESLICGNHYLLAIEEAAICSVGPDVYEPDNLYPQVVDIPTDGTLQARTFHVAADKDWAGFYALAGHVYTVTTSQLGADVDTVLELYDADGVTLLDENDDYLPGSNASRIVWAAPAEGRYYVRVTHFDRTYDPRESLVCGNQYLISVEATSCDVAPDMYESDNFYTQAAVIPTDGTVQTHTFHVAADKDWVKFFAWGGQIYTATTSRLSPDVDTVLQLYDADGVTLLLENDDYLPGSDASHLVWTAPADGWYYVRIAHFDTTYNPRRSSFCGNQYQIAMRQQILDVTKTAEVIPARLRPGDEILYTIVVTNLMNIPQTRIVITDAIPDYTTFVSGSVSVGQGSVSGPDPLVADVGTLAPGQRVVFTFRVALREDSRGQTIINQAVAASDQRILPVSSLLTSVIVYRYIYLPIVIK